MLFKSLMLIAAVAYTLSAVSYWKGYGNWLRVFLLSAVILNISALVTKGYIDGRWYVYSMADEICLVPAAIAIVSCIILKRCHEKRKVLVFCPLVITALIAAVLPYQPVIPSLKSMVIVSPLFFLTEAASAALFLTAGMLALETRLCGADTEKQTGRLIMWGFLMFTVCQILGAVWAFLGWSYPFSWSTRHLLSTSVWCLYAALLHAHLIRLGGSAKAFLTVGGIIPIVYMVYHHQITNGLTFILGVLT
jgi:hypothetical protein